MTTKPIRQAEWGHWGITFVERINQDDYAPSRILGTLYFPVGNCGPCDLEGRARYRAAIAAWHHDGTLPLDLRP